MADMNRIEALKQIEQTLPIATAEREKRQQAARAIQMQQAVAQGATDANALGTASTKAQGAITQQNQQQQAQQQAQIAQMQQAEKASQDQMRLNAKKLAANSRLNDLERRMQRIDERAKSQLFDKEVQIKTDAMGRAVMTERNLMDWAIVKAKNEEELKDFQAKTQIASQRAQAIAKHVGAMLQSEMQRASAQDLQGLDQETRKWMTERQQDINKYFRDRTDMDAARAAMYTTYGSMAGAVVGGVAGGLIAAYGSGGTATTAGVVGGAALGVSAGGAMGGGLGMAAAGSQGSSMSSSGNQAPGIAGG